jgi:hypothetical protein
MVTNKEVGDALVRLGDVFEQQRVNEEYYRAQDRIFDFDKFTEEDWDDYEDEEHYDMELHLPHIGDVEKSPRMKTDREMDIDTLLEAVEGYSDDLINMALVPSGPCIKSSVLTNSDRILEACSRIRELFFQNLQ